MGVVEKESDVDGRVRDKVCCLLFDKMSLNSGLSYDVSTDTVYGYEELGSGTTSSKPCNSAFVFIAEGLCKKWKQPFGFFPSHNTALTEALKRLVETAISKLHAIGLHVHVMVCDQGATNQQMFRLLHARNLLLILMAKRLLSCTTRCT